MLLYLNMALITMQCFSSIVMVVPTIGNLCVCSIIFNSFTFESGFLVAYTTAPNHSRKSPVERIMSLVNIGLQCVGVMRSKISDETEEKIKNCYSLEKKLFESTTGR